MALTLINTRAQLGISAPRVRVEVHISNGLPAFTVVGLPETVVREARDRVRSAILNSGFEFPARRITVNLAPADLPKEGGRYDLPIALGILSASRQIDITTLKEVDCYGELALGGECRKVHGLLPALISSKQSHYSAIVPIDNRAEASLVKDMKISIADSLTAVCRSLNGGDELPGVEFINHQNWHNNGLDLADVYGQQQAKRALSIAAAGGHHMLMMGPPGTGKSMLAQRINSILPDMNESEAMSSASIRSICNLPVNPENWLQRPFQSPHHSVSSVALAGGGSNPKPGEISLAHNGILFLDELTEFDRRSIEVLREPLETGQIHISRARRQAIYPARFQLVAAMNPCPGGCESIQRCECAPDRLRRYRHKLSAPLLDRIDIQIELARLSNDELMTRNRPPGENSASARALVASARAQQHARQNCLNSQLSPTELEKYCVLDTASEQLLKVSIEKLRLSARSYHKLLKLARTIADLSTSEAIEQAHIAEAICYRLHQGFRA